MLSRWFLFTIIITLCLSFGCGSDSPTKPTPAEKFELRIAVVDSSGTPVPGLVVSIWTDTIMVTPEQSVAAIAAQTTIPHLYGDVDCNGRAFTSWDVDYMTQYVVHQPRSLTEEQIDCIERNGDVVPATKGVTVADFSYMEQWFDSPAVPDGRTLRYSETNYLYDDSTGIISFPYASGVEALLLTYEKPGFSWPSCPGLFYNYGYDSSYYYALAWSDGPFWGDVVQGYGTLHSIEAAGQFGQPLRLTRVAHQAQIGVWDSDLSDSVLLCWVYLTIMRPVEIEIFDLENRLVDDTVINTWPDRSISWTPDSLFSTVYRFEMEVVEAESLVVRDTAYGVFWSDDPARTTVGQTDSNGGIVVSDIRLFPNLFDLPTLWVADTTYPYESTQFIFSDSVTVHVRDTATGEFKEQRFMLGNGQNDVTVAWP